jgi:hypothetical protein
MGLNPVTNIALQGQGGVTNEQTNVLCQRRNLRRMIPPTDPILAPGLFVMNLINSECVVIHLTSGGQSLWNCHCTVIVRCVVATVVVCTHGRVVLLSLLP